MRNISDKSCRESQNTYFGFNNLFKKSCHLWRDANTYCWARQATDDSMAHMHCMLDN